MNPLLLTTDPDHPIYRMDLTPEASAAVDTSFETSVNTFESDIEDYIEFDAGYQLIEGECFQIEDFQISDQLIQAGRQPLTAERLNQAELPFLVIKAIVGYDFQGNRRRLFFQNFDSRRVIIPGRKLALFGTADASTFRELNRPVVLLDGPIAAIWDNGNLRFKSFHQAKQIFDLGEYFAEATTPQLNEFAEHARIACPDVARFVAACNSWSRKKVALILRSRVLDEFSMTRIRRAAQAVRYRLAIDGNRIVLPAEKRELRALLQFLDEDIYRGPISRRRYLASGHRNY